MVELTEKCGVFGIFAPKCDVARITHAGLWSLQHRGQEGTGIAVSDGERITIKKNLGLVTQVYSEKDLQKLTGHIAVGHNRYSTSGGLSIEHVQPVLRHNKQIALAHNGNLPDTSELEVFLNSLGIATLGSNDSEMITDALSHFLVKGKSIEQAVKKVFPHLVGAFSLILMTKDKLIAIRDANGLRPLCIGTMCDGHVISSENCVFPIIGAEFLREVKPGEMIVISKRGLKSTQLARGSENLDIFEFVYFARADSSFMGKRVNEVRKNFGKELAREAPVKNADIIVAVPDSSFPAAEGFSTVSGVLVQNGFIKNGYVHRTFIRPEQSSREMHLNMKLNPIPEVVAGKSVILVDDSLVRGTTTKHLVHVLKKAGAREVHVRISSPPVLYPDFYGINTPTQAELLATRMTQSEIADYIGADSIAFLTYNGLIKASGLPKKSFCTSCFTGTYPVSIGKHANEVKKVSLTDFF